MATFSLNYSANGGSGAPTPSIGTSSDLIYTFTVKSGTPTRTGYIFRGWASSSSASSATYQAGDDVAVTRTEMQLSVSRTIYAVWQRRTYTVSYSANGGSGAPGSQTKSYGIDLTLSSTRPSRSGYTFEGWATSSSGGVSYSPGDTYTDNASITLYAVWDEDAPTTYTVSYSANGGSGAPGSQTFTAGSTLTLSSVVPTRPDYNFLGWNTTPAATVAKYLPGGTYTGGSVTLYAVWEFALESYAISYNVNGGSGAPGGQTKIENTDITLSLVTPTRYPYRFLGWNTAADGSGTNYAPSTVYAMNAPLTLYAQWELIESDTSGGASNIVQGGQIM